MSDLVTLGADKIVDYAKELGDLRLGILANKASLLSNGESLVESLCKHADFNVTALFGPEHGLFMNAEYMYSVDSSVHPELGIPVFSLYSENFESLSPTKEMLEKIDVLICDLPDVGSRYYTYVWTLVLCMKECAKYGKKVVVCDRPNPINGVSIEGSGIKQGFESFVGLYSLPNRHGMTIGEIAKYINEKYEIGADLEIIKMSNWVRKMFMSDTGLKWVNPSPNMRSLNTAILYPGMCLLEGTNVSEGRGTDTPFEIIGAPFIDSEELVSEIEKLNLIGLKVAPTSFIPMNDKHMGKICNGVRWVITDENKANSYLAGLATIWAVNKLYKDNGFKWRETPYEFVSDKPAIDLLTGSDYFRNNINDDFESIVKLSIPDEDFLKERKSYLFYD